MRPWAAFAALAAVAAAVIAYLGRHWMFFYDEWGVILYRRSGGASAFLAPLNGHLLAAPLLVYRVLFATVGLRSYTPYRWVTIAAHLLLMTLVYMYARRRLPWWLAVLCVVPLMFLGYAWQVLFWMMNLGFMFPMIALLGILLLGDVERPKRWTAPANALLLLLALASSGLGIAVAAGTGLEVAARRERWREIPWLSAPVVVYLAWFLAYRPSGNTPAALRALPGASPTGDVGAHVTVSTDLHGVVRYVLQVAETAASGLVGSSTRWWWGALILVLIVGGLAVTRRVSIRFVSLGVVAIVFWLLTALARSGAEQPTASRYIYPGAVLLVLLLVEAWVGVGFRSWAASRVVPVAVALTACVAVCAVSSLHTLRAAQGAAKFAADRTTLARLQCPGRRAPATYAPDLVQLPWVKSALYLAAVRDLGSPVPRSTIRAVCGTASRAG